MLTPDDFAGDWHLSRVLTDRLGTMNGSLEGTATLRPADTETLVYTETGDLTLATGAVLRAERSYRWRWEGDRVVVTFADGADFHDFRPEGQSPGTAHLCGADLYEVTYDLRGWPRWEATWEVRGPKKNYLSVSRYTRP